ncbi:hypothetical protein AKJ09_11424 [Labilithrix luteola]|uniref:Uncharacterized protein n=1 Tax=Labilithrix luteola TaxID=1391654 RepID=A0A0K1QG70_9BACT|nr:hypothetical protein AKJ09_11424 [Labilithrix luteola]
MSPAAAAALAAARPELGPSEHDRRRLREEIRKRIASGAQGPVDAPPTARPQSFLTGRGMKLVGVCVVAFAVGAVATRQEVAPAVRLAPTPVVRAAVAEPPLPASAPSFATISADALPDAPTVPSSVVRDLPTAPRPSTNRGGKPSMPSATDSLGGEVVLLREAQDALNAGDIARAGQRLDVHAASYPRGLLREERLALHALVHCAEGRVAEAKRAAEELMLANPRSSHLARLRGSCVAETVAPSNPRE